MTAAGPGAVAADSMTAGYSAAGLEAAVDRREAAESLAARQADLDLRWAVECCYSMAPCWAEALQPVAADLQARVE